MVTTIWASEVRFALDSDVVSSSSGYIQLTWTATDENDSFVLEQSVSSDFESVKTIYSGPDLATFVSGLPDGQYYFRVHGKDQKWSSTLQLNVQHQSLQLALSLSAIGFLVFVMTVGVVVRGSFKSQQT